MVIAILKSQEGQEHTSLLQLLGQEIKETNPNKILTFLFFNSPTKILNYSEHT